MEEFILGTVSGKMEEFLKEKYQAEQIEPVDYLLYNTRQQVLNLFYPEDMEKITEESRFSPEAGEEESLRFDEMVETFDRETAKSEYTQYRFSRETAGGAKAIFYITVEKNTGFVMTQYEWDEEAEQPEEISDEDYNSLNLIMRDILLTPYSWVENLEQYPAAWERYQTTKCFWDEFCGCDGKLR